jgi:hypothetical protein
VNIEPENLSTHSRLNSRHKTTIHHFKP